SVKIKPFGTEIIRPGADLLGVPSSDRAESVSINYSGPSGCLIAMGYTSSADGKFASMIRFYDTQHVVQQNLYANNLRLDHAEPHMVLRNTSADFITATPTFLPVSGNSDQAVKFQRLRL